jgi:hypothetical protein
MDTPLQDSRVSQQRNPDIPGESYFNTDWHSALSMYLAYLAKRKLSARLVELL